MMEIIPHDPRLTDLIDGQYRILHDSQKIMIPLGMSTTKPLAPEIALCNLKIYGTINQSYFMPPWVDFINTEVDTKRYDRYQLGVWRPNDPEEDFPFDNPSVDYHDDLGLKTIVAQVVIDFAIFGQDFTDPVGYAFGRYSGQVDFDYVIDKTWTSGILHFDRYAPERLVGDFFLVTNPLPEHIEQGKVFATSLFLQNTNLPVSAVVKNAKLYDGNMAMPLLQSYNATEWPLQLASEQMTVKGGE